jgi:hypothetical protein
MVKNCLLHKELNLICKKIISFGTRFAFEGYHEKASIPNRIFCFSLAMFISANAFIAPELPKEKIKQSP